MGANQNNFVNPAHADLVREVRVQFQNADGDWEETDSGLLCYLDAHALVGARSEIQPEILFRLWDVTKGRAVCAVQNGLSRPLTTITVHYKDITEQVSDHALRPFGAIGIFAARHGLKLAELISDRYDFARAKTDDGDRIDAFEAGKNPSANALASAHVEEAFA